MTDTHQQLLANGRVDEALSAVKQAIRDDPGNVAYRTCLFQVLAVQGEWEKALEQLQVLRDLDDVTIPMVDAYSRAVQSESLRESVFLGKHQPLIFGEPAEWIALLVQSLALFASGETERASEIRAEAFEQAPATTGSANGQQFEWIADSDSRLGPILEVIVNGQYSWVPFNRIQRIQVEPPEDLRDIVWMPANFQWTNGGEIMALIPTRYPFSHNSSDDRIRLSRQTIWEEPVTGTWVGQGQRILATDSSEIAVMDIRDIVFDA